MMNKYLSVSQIASISGRHEETVRRWIREGLFTEIKKGINNMTLVSEDEVLRFISKEPPKNTNLISYLNKLNISDSPTWDLKVGQILTFEKLKHVTNCPTIRGIRYRSNASDLSIITTIGSGNNSKNPYEDRFEQGHLFYTGEGQKGDQKLTSGNLRLYEAEISKQPVHVFQKLEKDRYAFWGIFRVVSNHIEKQPDSSGEVRDVFIFELEPIIKPQLTEVSKVEGNLESLLRDLELIQTKLKNEKVTKETLENRYKRSRDLVGILKKLYNYKCQLCDPNNPIPLIEMKNGKYYVEVHRIDGFGEVLGKEDEQENGNFVIDSVNNVICVCVHHHKLLHHYHSKINYVPTDNSFVAEDGSLVLPLYKRHSWHTLSGR